MAIEAPFRKAGGSSAPAKLPRLSKGTNPSSSPSQFNPTNSPLPDQRIQKRPLLHPAVAPARKNASTPKIVYVSSTSPFISTVKRVRLLLSHAEKRASTGVDIYKGSDRAVLKALEADVTKAEKGAREEVTMKATGKAIEKLLQLAIWFQGQDDYVVKLRTRSVGAVDDVVTVAGEDEGCEESHVRMTSSLEVSVSLR